MSETGKETAAIWTQRAQRLLEAALGEVIDGVDAIPTVEAAAAALRIACGELPAEELEGYPFPGEERTGPACICPPDLLARGGYRGNCPATHLYPA
jgi:hypothetical protein